LLFLFAERGGIKSIKELGWVAFNLVSTYSKSG
jgi:hypothetical protein